MGKLLLLGGSQSQLNAAIKAKQLGHTVILADYLPHPPAAEVSDAHERVSTFDVEGCIEAARKHQVTGVFTVGSDQPVFTAAKVAVALQLPSPISVETATKATNKRVMKNAFREHGIPTAPHVFLKPGDSQAALSGLQPPLVIKPLDSQGQRGVFKLQTATEVIAHLKETLSYSRETAALVENYYPSREVTLSAFVVDGRVYPLTLTDRQLMEDPLHIGVCVAHRYPSIFQDQTAAIEHMAKRVARALGIQRGPLYIQYLVGDKGVIVNEAAARIGGAFEDVFIPSLTGFDILEAVIRLAAGEPLPPESIHRIQRPGGDSKVSAQLVFCRPGTIASITPLEALMELPCVLSAGYNYSEGDQIPSVENATARFGHCVLATDGGDIDEALARLYQTLHVIDTKGDNLVIPRNFDGKGLYE